MQREQKNKKNQNDAVKAEDDAAEEDAAEEDVAEDDDTEAEEDESETDETEFDDTEEDDTEEDDALQDGITKGACSTNNTKTEDLIPVSADAKAKQEHKAMIAAKAIARERQNLSLEDQLMGEKELPGVLRCLARFYDFQNSRLLDKPREASVKPVCTVVKLEPAKLREVPVVPPELETMLMEQPSTSRWLEQQLKFNEHGLKHNPLSSSNMVRNNAKPRPLFLHMTLPSGVRVTRKPIIVVPSEFISLVTLHNVQSLLQELRFVPPAVMRRSDLRLLDEVNIVRCYRGEEQQYRVIDNVTRLTKEDWTQVVAVFVLNPHSQFIGWPHHGDPVRICRQLCAFHLHYKGQAIFRDLESLWLNMLSLPEHERHLDRQILNEFWRKLDQHMAENDRQEGFIKPK